MSAPVDTPEPTGESQARRSLRALFVFAIIALSLLVAGGAVHIVRPGETLSEIAARHGTSTAALADANGLANADFILVGQELTIPGTGDAAGTETHVVRSGEFLAAIAAEYGTTVQAIVEANSIHNPHLIRVGQRLRIPAAGANGEAAPLYHVVQRGESLASIAADYGVAVEQLAAANGMTVTSVIYEGTQLRLSPATAGYEPSGGGAQVHVVESGETLAVIAARYDTTVNEIVRRNDITNPNLIRPGQRLTVAGGGFVCPVPGATFFNDWGFPRSGGRFHEGNDMFAARGAKVLAPVAGRVDQVEGTVGGIQFWLYGDDGHLYIGTHMDAFGSGGRVSAGTVIGYVGDSGNARGARPHLHFEILVDGETAVNPYPTLVAACR